MDDKHKYASLIKDTLIFALGSIGSKIILFFLVPLYTNILTTDEYGIAELFHTLAEILSPVLCLTVYNAIVRFGLSKDEKPEDVFVNGLLVCVLGSICAIACAPLSTFYKPLKDWGWSLSVFIITAMFLNAELNYLKIKDKNKLFALISIIQTLTLAIINIYTIVYLRIGVSGYIYSYIISSTVALAIPFIFPFTRQDIKKGKINKQLVIRMLKYSSPLVLAAISWWVINSSDKLMIEGMIGASALGIYTAATKIPSLINVLSNIFSQAWGISSIKEIESSNDEKFYSEVFTVFATFLFAASLIIVSVIRPIMSIYVGNDFASSWIYVPLLLVAAVFSAISGFFSSLYAALKKSMNNMVTTFICALLNIAINYFGIMWLGVMGAVIGTIASYLVLAFIKMFDVNRFVHINVDKSYYINSLLVITQAVLVSIGFTNILISISIMTVFIVINLKNLNKIISKITSIIKR